MNETGVIQLDCTDREQVRAIAELHGKLLSDSPIPQLGRSFMTEFYYAKLPEDRLIECYLYQHEGRCVAFLVFTKHPFGFMREGRRRHLISLGLSIMKSLVSRPSRIAVIVKIARLGGRRLSREDGKTAEILSFGVEEPYRGMKDETAGLRISNLLFEKALACLKDEGFTMVQGEIRKDNKEALLFWKSYGGRIEGSGWTRKGCCLVCIDL